MVAMLTFTPEQIGINRIRLEFKDSYNIAHVSPFLVLIESDWNLKGINGDTHKFAEIVLIESDWNLKMHSPCFSSSKVMCINRIRLEFKVCCLCVHYSTFEY